MVTFKEKAHNWEVYVCDAQIGWLSKKQGFLPNGRIPAISGPDLMTIAKKYEEIAAEGTG